MRQLLIYGALGLCLEVLFTGIRNLLRRRWSAQATTYLWMPLVYGPAGVILHQLSSALDGPVYLRAVVYTFVIYCCEFLGGIMLAGLTDLLKSLFGGEDGNCPWDYGDNWWTPMGVINLAYVPLWYCLALCFDVIDSMVGAI